MCIIELKPRYQRQTLFGCFNVKHYCVNVELIINTLGQVQEHGIGCTS